MAALTSSVAALLVSNAAPHPAQTTLTQKILEKKRTELFLLGAQISELQSRLQNLQSQHADLASEITQYQSIISPIRLLPPEIIGEIFLYFIPSLPHPHFDRIKLPWKLGHICHLWREIAISLGELWSVLDLYYRSPSACTTSRFIRPDVQQEEEEFTQLPLPEAWQREIEEDYEIQNTLDFVEECVQRAGNRPLCLRMQHLAYQGNLHLFRTLMKHSARWGEFVLVNPHDDPDCLLYRISHLEGRLPLLQKLAFFSAYEPRFRYQCAPNLTDLTLVDVHMPSRSDLRVPWSQLTRYCEDRCSWHRPAERLESYRQMSNLLVLRLAFQQSDSHQLLRGIHPAQSGVLLPRVLVASFRETQATAIQLFDMPALEAFSSMDAYGAGQLRDYVPHSSPHLQILRVNVNVRHASPALREDDAESILEMYPHLTEITLDVPGLILNRFISRLIPYDRLPLAPQLEMIRFSNKSFLHQNCQWQTLVQMLKGRFQPTMDGVAALRTFEFPTDERSEDENVMMGLRRLAKEEHWDIRVGDECRVLEWDDMHVQ
ncbi:hypothetical protein B0H11DRAFT_2022082 [Mycena galericulata]|nr:hypothetical protein B0H11DRAFT_2022082 [Mycena galericulata]